MWCDYAFSHTYASSTSNKPVLQPAQLQGLFLLTSKDLYMIPARYDMYLLHMCTHTHPRMHTHRTVNFIVDRRTTEENAPSIHVDNELVCVCVCLCLASYEWMRIASPQICIPIWCWFSMKHTLLQKISKCVK